MFVIIEIEFKAELGGSDADFEGITIFFRACQRELKFHLCRKRMTEDLG
jgi:hypothetical protein